MGEQIAVFLDDTYTELKTRNNPFLHGAVGIPNSDTELREEHDYYGTHPVAAEYLMQIENLDHNIWECACGEGNLSRVFERAGHNVLSTDLIDRGYGKGGIDFLSTYDKFDGDIITNPPYKVAEKFVLHALELIPDGKKVCMFLNLRFLEGKRRKEIFEKTPLKTVWVSSGRIPCSIRGHFVPSMIAYGWYIWEKGYKGETTLKWFN